MAAETTQAQCHAITEDGERCDRPAGEDGFCHQHDESDETVDAYDESEDESAEGDGSAAGDDDVSDADEESGDAEETESGRESESESESDVGLGGVRDVRETVQTLAPEIIGRELDAVIEVDGRDDGWRAVVEVVERPAVPDTQDILGRYEIDLADGAVTGYRRVDRYRRSDTDAGEPR